MGRFLKTLVAILGGASIGGALIVVLVVTLGGSAGRQPLTAQEQLQERMSPGSITGTGWGDLDVSLVLGAVAVGLLVILGVVAWVLYGREAWFQEQVDEIYGSSEVRLIGVPLASGALGGGFYTLAELSFATPDHPPDFADLWPFMGGMVVLGLCGYALLAGLVALVRRVLAPPAPPPDDQSADLASK